MLEGLTGFGFPRDAELCTRYATQITCRREVEKSISVSIIPHADAAQDEQERVKKFHRELKDMTPESLAQVFREVRPYTSQVFHAYVILNAMNTGKRDNGH